MPRLPNFSLPAPTSFSIQPTISVFEKAYIDRSLEVTGQQMVVITPGAGMFEVDRELATITKRKVVDNGKINWPCLFQRYLINNCV
jgi:hypothetical protein